MSFNNENEFELAFIQALQQHGWEADVIAYPSEADLLANWANILFENNRETDRLNNQPLTAGEMAQIIEQINVLKTPFKLNGFINGKTVVIKRDNPADTLHLGKEISLKVYDRLEIAAGKSRYQIVRQPRFSTHNAILPQRRGDIMLLINGMPVFHIELKKSGVPLSEASNQIEKYLRNGVFSNLFALVQLFVVATPEEALYFANSSGADGKLNPSYFFHWGDFDNEPVNHWKDVAGRLLSIPMAHQLIGWYTVADEGDGVLKVMRSYQYYAASGIASAVAKADWQAGRQRGGYIWHTTGSGKTMTSFKSAQLIADSKNADKVVFLMDRIELGTQSLNEYRNIADSQSDVQETASTVALIAKLKSSDPKDTLIVTSIQKMSHIQEEDGVNEQEVRQIADKRIVFIVDECHRTTFGDMMKAIKTTFPNALFFGFTGTPIHEENQRKNSTTSDVFGNELHRYSLADGIRDGNVLGFDVYRVPTFKDSDLRREIGLLEAKAADVAEAMGDEQKKAVYLRFQDSKQMPMAGFYDKNGEYCPGIEDHLPKSQYGSDKHRRAVVGDIVEKWDTLSQGGMFQAIFATSSIPEAIAYYRLFKQAHPHLKVSALFDPNEGNSAGYAFKETGIMEILDDYNTRYGQHFTMPTYAAFKKDVANRLARKAQYKFLHHEKEPHKILDILIVVDQMLTGFDAKWVNTLYVDKLMRYENIIQAFSRTNRLFGREKQFGTIRYYRYPHTMQRNVAAAVKLFSGDKAFGLFVDKLPANIRHINDVFSHIQELFAAEKQPDFIALPESPAARAKFAKLFRELTGFLDAAKVQGFDWAVADSTYEEDGQTETTHVDLDEQTYLTLLLRYKELAQERENPNGGDSIDEIPFEIDTHITELDTERIDSDYMNTQFEKYLRLREAAHDVNDLNQILADLHKSFASLTQNQQKHAGIFLNDVQSGTIHVQPGKPLRDYITDYEVASENKMIDEFVQTFGLDKGQLVKLLAYSLTETNLNEYSRFDRLRDTVDKAKAKAYFEQLEGKPVSPPMVNVKFNALLKDFVLSAAKE